MDRIFDEGTKVRIDKMYCSVKADGYTRESNLRYVVCDLLDGYILLAKTKRQYEKGEGQIYHKSIIL